MEELYEGPLSNELHGGATPSEVRESPGGLERSGGETLRNQAPPGRVKTLKLLHTRRRTRTIG